MIKAIIIDDDQTISLTLQNYINKTEGIELIKDFSNPLRAIEYLKKNEIDLVFLDIEMPEMTGLEVLKYIDLPQVIIISSKKEYAAEAFDFDVSDFIHKPIVYGRFLKALEKVNKIKNNFTQEDKNSEIFFIKEGSLFIKIALADITYIEATGDYIKIFTENEKHVLLSTMKSIENKFKDFQFSRIHRSFIINLKHITKIEDDNIFIGGISLPLSRFYKSDFLKKINIL